MPSLSLKIVQDEGAVTRKVKFDSHMTVKDAHKVVKDKVIVANKGQEYALFLRSADDDMSGVWLENDRTLDYYLLRDGDSLDYICRMRNLRVRLLDDTVKTLQVDEAKTVGELMMDICARIGIKNYDEYGLIKEEVEEPEDGKETKEPSGGGFTLRRPKPVKERDVILEQMSKRLKTDDNVEWLDQHRTIREQGIDFKETLLLKRRLFYSDRNVDSRDPVQLHLLYVQTRDAILMERHHVTEQQGAHCKVRWINIRDVHRRILKKNATDPEHPPRQYKYERELAFMRPFYRDVVVPSLEDEEEPLNKNWHDLVTDSPNEEIDLNPCSDDNDTNEPIIKKVKTKKRKSKKRKEPCFEEVNQTINLPSFSEPLSQSSELDSTDPVDAFLLSIGSTLKTFTPYHLNVAKTKIFAVVQDHDLQQIVEKQKNGHSSDVKVSTTDTLYLL